MMNKIKVKVLKEFRDKYTGITYKPGEILHVTPARHREILHSGNLVELVKETKAEKK